MKLRRNILLGLALALSACAEFTPDGGMAPITVAARAQLGAEPAKITTAQDAARVRQAVQEFLRAPISAEIAVRIALINNQDLQVAFNDLGLAEVAHVAAGLVFVGDQHERREAGSVRGPPAAARFPPPIGSLAQFRCHAPILRQIRSRANEPGGRAQ